MPEPLGGVQEERATGIERVLLAHVLYVPGAVAVPSPLPRCVPGRVHPGTWRHPGDQHHRHHPSAQLLPVLRRLRHWPHSHAGLRQAILHEARDLPEAARGALLLALGAGILSSRPLKRWVGYRHGVAGHGGRPESGLDHHLAGEQGGGGGRAPARERGLWLAAERRAGAARDRPRGAARPAAGGARAPGRREDGPPPCDPWRVASVGRGADSGAWKDRLLRAGAAHHGGHAEGEHPLHGALRGGALRHGHPRRGPAARPRGAPRLGGGPCRHPWHNTLRGPALANLPCSGGLQQGRRRPAPGRHLRPAGRADVGPRVGAPAEGARGEGADKDCRLPAQRRAVVHVRQSGGHGGWQSGGGRHP
mmetsp:Transcript_32259/g.92868  ORF Transcript_32259/g.92868 Transcript_32259/m.92868 type:complete len:363 (+) Transcript_32259:508-1596(+)